MGKEKTNKPECPKCPKCGTKLIDAGNYKWDCPNDCFPVSLELQQMEDMAKIEQGDY